MARCSVAPGRLTHHGRPAAEPGHFQRGQGIEVLPLLQTGRTTHGRSGCPLNQASAVECKAPQVRHRPRVGSGHPAVSCCLSVWRRSLARPSQARFPLGRSESASPTRRPIAPYRARSNFTKTGDEFSVPLTASSVRPRAAASASLSLLPSRDAAVVLDELQRKPLASPTACPAARPPGR